MGERWIKEAEDLRAAGSSGTMSRNHNNPKVTWHVTVSPPGSFNAVHGVLTRNRSEPHFIYDPKTDRLGQYFACDRGARALANDGSTPTNRDGTINIQIEVCAWPGDIHSGQQGFTDIPEFDPTAPNWRALMRCIRSWGIPDRWPGDVARGSWASDSVSRSWSTYRRAGHHAHSEVPGNDHWDPGNISIPRLFATGGSNAGSSAPAPSKPKAEKYYDPPVKRSVKSIQKIVGVKADSYYGSDTKKAVAAYQKKLGVTSDGYWGSRTEAAHVASQKKGGGKKKPTAKAPAFPLPKGWYFGPKSGPKQSVSGYYSHRADLRRWQQRMKDRGWSITPDGLYGNRTAAVALAFQKEKGLSADSLIGDDTWRAAWSEPVT